MTSDLNILLGIMNDYINYCSRQRAAHQNAHTPEDDEMAYDYNVKANAIKDILDEFKLAQRLRGVSI